MTSGLSLLMANTAGRQLAQTINELSIKEERVRMRNNIMFPATKGLLSIRFDDNDLTVYTNAFPLLKAKAFPFTQSVVANMVGNFPDHPKLTMAQIKEMARSGGEIVNHSFIHSDVPTTSSGMKLDVVDSKKYWEDNTGCSVKAFVAPGSWAGNYPTIDSELGQLIFKTHCFYEAYDGKTIKNRPNNQWFAHNHETGDNMTLEQLSALTDKLCGTGLSMTILFHFVGYSGEGVSTSIFSDWLDYVKTKQGAGLLDVVTDTSIMSAGIGDTLQCNINPNFEILDGLQPYGYTTSGSPSLSTDTPKTGTYVARCTNTNYYKYSFVRYPDEQSPIYRAKVWCRTLTTGTGRIIVSNTPYGFTAISKTTTTTAGWSQIELCFMIPNNVPSVTISLQPSVGDVDYDDLTIERIS